MTSLRWQCICIDSPDPAAVAGFWEAALGWRRTHEDPDEVVLEPPAGSPEDGVSPDILFLRVPEAKAVKNRLHLDLQSADRTRDEEVGRLLALGARLVDDRRTPTSGWAVLADPEGNEFCVVLNAAERARPG